MRIDCQSPDTTVSSLSSCESTVTITTQELSMLHEKEMEQDKKITDLKKEIDFIKQCLNKKKAQIRKLLSTNENLSWKIKNSDQQEKAYRDELNELHKIWQIPRYSDGDLVPLGKNHIPPSLKKRKCEFSE